MASKISVMKYLAFIYYPLGILSPITLKGKLIFRDLCDEKYTWDQPLEGEYLKRWIEFKTSLPSRVIVQRSVVKEKKDLDSGDAATIYAVTRQRRCEKPRAHCHKFKITKEDSYS